MVKQLVFKGDKRPKKRKRPERDADPSADRPSTPDQPQGDAQAEDDEIENDDSWVSAEVPSDVSGPVILVLETAPPAALACDPAGRVFVMRLENVVDGNPASAEPHDARQVWVANHVAGTAQFRFKNRHGSYLSCDADGALSATSQAVSSLESFTLTAAPATTAGPFTFFLQTARDTYLSVSSGAAGPSAGEALAEQARPAPEKARARGNAASSAADGVVLRIRMQARFKPRIQRSREVRARERVSRRELESAAGRRLDEDEVSRLKRARREGDYHEQLLMIKVKSKHDKFG